MVSPRTHTQRVRISGAAVSGGKIAVTAPAGGGGSSVSAVAVTGQPVAVSQAGVIVSANKLGVDLVGVDTSGGKIKTTAPAGGAASNVNIINVSGDVRVTADGDVPFAVSAAGANWPETSAPIMGLVDDLSPTDVNENALGMLRMTSARALHIQQQGNITINDPIAVSAAAGALGVAVTGNVGISAAVPVAVSQAGVTVSANKLSVDLPGVAISAGKVSVTAPAGTGVAVSSVLVTGNVSVTDPLSVSAAGATWPQHDVSAHGQVSAHISNTVSAHLDQDPLSVSAGAANWPVGVRSDAVYQAEVSAPVKFATVDIAAAACAAIVAGVSGRKIRVHNYTLVSDGTVGARWCTTTPFTALTGSMDLARGVAPGEAFLGHFEGAVDDALCIQLEGAVSTQGYVVYSEIT